jgi:hypothetical protein
MGLQDVLHLLPVLLVLLLQNQIILLMPFLYGSSRCTAPPATSALAAELDNSINANSLWVFKM